MAAARKKFQNRDRGEWSEWREFPNPKRQETLVAPFGSGCYELRHSNGKLILFGSGGHVALRMTSLLPHPQGCKGHRNNDKKRTYIWEHIDDVEYRTAACATRDDARIRENEELKANKHQYVFKT